MKVRGIKTTSEQVIIDISPKELFDTLKKELLSKIIPSVAQGHDAVYINGDGHWESWDNGRGSGDTEVYRRAHPAELKAMTLIKEFESLVFNELREGK